MSCSLVIQPHSVNLNLYLQDDQLVAGTVVTQGFPAVTRPTATPIVGNDQGDEGGEPADPATPYWQTCFSKVTIQVDEELYKLLQDTDNTVLGDPQIPTRFDTWFHGILLHCDGTWNRT